MVLKVDILIFLQTFLHPGFHFYQNIPMFMIILYSSSLSSCISFADLDTHELSGIEPKLLPKIGKQVGKGTILLIRKLASFKYGCCTDLLTVPIFSAMKVGFW